MPAAFDHDHDTSRRDVQDGHRLRRWERLHGRPLPRRCVHSLVHLVSPVAQGRRRSAFPHRAGARRTRHAAVLARSARRVMRHRRPPLSEDAAAYRARGPVRRQHRHAPRSGRARARLSAVESGRDGCLRAARLRATLHLRLHPDIRLLRAVQPARPGAVRRLHQRFLLGRALSRISARLPRRRSPPW